jgi:hypothetical protein
MTKKGNVFVILNAVKNFYGPCSEKGQLLAQRYFPTKPEQQIGFISRRLSKNITTLNPRQRFFVAQKSAPQNDKKGELTGYSQRSEEKLKAFHQCSSNEPHRFFSNL